MKKLGKIILVLGICLSMVGISYIVTKYLDKNMYLNTNLLVTFEDNKEFNLESLDVLNKEEAREVYPNKFTIENRSLKSVKYNVILKEIETNINKENLSYILYLNDKEVKSGKVSEINEVLYTKEIGLKKTDEYKLYLYLTEKETDAKYNYKIEIDS
ncbi:MAG: hypothetical protein IKN63_05910 [Bacilli bacterium]|nr:hypothetical protein [Bacilli bacterium]